jgi:hypothetical protein
MNQECCANPGRAPPRGMACMGLQNPLGSRDPRLKPEACRVGHTVWPF